MWLKLLPLRWIARQWAKGSGFMDPVDLAAKIQRFAQPSEVAVPLELLRLGTALHLRGLINAQAIQHNLDWVWPFWVERQFDPRDVSFIPRAFSLSHINMTQRNWTAVGLPGVSDFSLVDPAGLVTPHHDGWSLDAWIMEDRGGTQGLFPSRLSEVSQTLRVDRGLVVSTASAQGPHRLITETEVIESGLSPVCSIRIKAESEYDSWCVVSLRPCNPEGISFIHDIGLLDKHAGWLVNGKMPVYFDRPPERCAFSDYRTGDVAHILPHARHRRKISCPVGMATAGAAFQIKSGGSREIGITVPLRVPDPQASRKHRPRKNLVPWKQTVEPACRLAVPDAKIRFLFDAALRSLVLHSPEEVYPGPFTYKHFWFRDAVFILSALMGLGFTEKAGQVIERVFLKKQTREGYFYSQEGEWDSNGQVLWLMARFCDYSGRIPPGSWCRAAERAARWIRRKRLSSKLDLPHAGLLPAGFSAEHLGPNDYYFWDDFWSAAGLASAGQLAALKGDQHQARELEKQSRDMLDCIDKSLLGASKRLGTLAMPASPYRRTDSGSIGSLAASYPLGIWDGRDPRILATLEYLLTQCSVQGGFFHDMSHSGINPYLTLHLAQCLLRAGDPRYYGLMKTVSGLASPTGQWPEAIHPKTLGGCMGDGQHVWASAEWVLMILNAFVRPEQNKLILFSGVPMEWLRSGSRLFLGPVGTPHGSMELNAECEGTQVRFSWKGTWHRSEPEMDIIFGGAAHKIKKADTEMVLEMPQADPLVSSR